MSKQSILARVEGYILSTPNGEREFDSLIALAKNMTEASKPVTIYTAYKLKDGSTERQDGYDLMSHVGQLAYKPHCKKCDAPLRWITSEPRGIYSDLCGECRKQQLEDDEVDVDSVYDRQSREDEY